MGICWDQDKGIGVICSVYGDMQCTRVFTVFSIDIVEQQYKSFHTLNIIDFSELIYRFID